MIRRPHAQLDRGQKDEYRRDHRVDTFWGYLSYILQFGSALILIPALLSRLSAEELGIWFVLLTISMASSMLDMGFTSAIARALSFVLAGSRTLMRKGFASASENGSVDRELRATVVSSARLVYFAVSLSALALLGTLGTGYIWAVAGDEVSLPIVLWSWCIFVVGTVAGLYLKQYASLLQGISMFRRTYQSTVSAQIAFVTVSFIGLQLGLGLLGIAAGFFAQSILGGSLNRHFFRTARPRWSGSVNNWRRDFAAVRTLWYNAWRQGLASVGAFLTIRGNILLVSAFLGLAEGASYGLSLQVFSALMSIASVPMMVRLPAIARQRASGQYGRVVSSTRVGIASALALYVLGALGGLLFLELPVSSSIGLSANLLPTALLAWMALTFLLELNHVLAASYLTTKNEVPFLWASIVSGVVVFACTFWGLRSCGYGVAWAIAAQFFVQLAYSNWRWPLLMLSDLRRISASGRTGTYSEGGG